MQYKWTVLTNTTLGVLMSSLDTNIVLIALPTIARQLPGTSLLDLIWILIGYQLITAAILVSFGRLADMFGRVKLYNLGFIIFTVGSALCSISFTSFELIFFRMIQGVGAAFLFSNSAAIITDAFPISERGKALGINQIAIVFGAAMGLVFGGFLVSLLGWRSIFWVNIPIGIFAAIWSHFKLKELATIEKGQRVDLTGNFTFAGGLALILVAITVYSLGSLSRLEALIMILFGLALIIFFVIIEVRTRYPMFNMALFKIRAFSFGSLALLLNALANGAVTIVLVFYLQGPTMRLTPLVAGIFLVPMSASLAVIGPISGILSDRYGQRFFAVLGLVISIIGFALLSRIENTITFTQLLIPLILVGVGMGFFASPNRSSIMSGSPPRYRGIASGMSATMNNVGRTFSTGIAFLVIAIGTPLTQLKSIFVGSAVQSNAPWVADFISSIHYVYIIGIVMLAAAIIPSVMIKKDAEKD
ncbi:MFS transporter [Oxyplasma meridianum]|uniref:MFS transporter n=1 Tax=Oxyplasma meridianum TaxID=3073602 RepID=A0AAX4NFB2_9ARCH